MTKKLGIVAILLLLALPLAIGKAYDYCGDDCPPPSSPTPTVVIYVWPSPTSTATSTAEPMRVEPAGNAASREEVNPVATDEVYPTPTAPVPPFIDAYPMPPTPTAPAGYP